MRGVERIGRVIPRTDPCFVSWWHRLWNHYRVLPRHLPPCCEEGTPTATGGGDQTLHLTSFKEGTELGNRLSHADRTDPLENVVDGEMENEEEVSDVEEVCFVMIVFFSREWK